MGKPRDFYEVLNIPKNSSPQRIRKAYKTLVKQWHPDKHPISTKPEAEAMFKAIAEAYEALIEIQGKPLFVDYDSGGGVGAPNRSRSRPPAPAPAASFRGEEDNRKPRSQPKDVHHTSSSQKSGFGSNSAPASRKPPPLERKLECTLEELFNGCKKEISFDRDVVVNGSVIRKEETQKIKVKPGWQKGTKITFEGMGDERPGCLPADVIYMIAEKEHPFFKRVGDDLVLKIEIPLVNALTGWTFSFFLITGEKMTLSFRDEIIHPGYEKVMEGHGMPLANKKDRRGDLRIRFQIRFPTKLSEEQRNVIQEALKNGC
ncbi:dnaJ homolog subfamily B member 13-like isoform X2 [Phalaenopsis equestris]|uniref:dnaJ homolog subfamily B member 13-like isoform X2 n=1 Tax=Phalaenopsis equestris TaxID=78828 RepID=UPI0009E4FDFD|nr:dnaJ homolog subfamily B member 13-like isoform X2 [Phalaenopsis equestris]